jgi:hypothetical protein
VAVDHADAVISLGEEGEGIDRSLPAFRARMERLDETCDEAGTDPTALRRCYFAGWANEPIFASTETTAVLVGRYAEGAPPIHLLSRRPGRHAPRGGGRRPPGGDP